MDNLSGNYMPNNKIPFNEILSIKEMLTHKWKYSIPIYILLANIYTFHI